MQLIDVHDVAVAHSPIAASGRRAESEAAARLVKEMLGDWAEVEHDDNGAPLLPGYPPGAISISHCKGYVAAAFSPDGGIGIDIETPRQQLERVASRFLSPDEQLIYKGILALLRAWTAKEAVYKAALRPGLELATGISLPIDGGDTAHALGHPYLLTYLPLPDALICLAQRVKV